MYLIKGILVFLWRLWFIVINIILVPFLGIISVFFLFKEKHYPLAYRLHRIWGICNLWLMGIVYKIEKQTCIDKYQPYVILSNHSSVMDIMLLYALIDWSPMVFIGKIELSKIPVFGYVYAKSNILVDRKSHFSGIRALKEAKRRIDLGHNVCIFPEGGVSNNYNSLASFKDGAFALAIEKQVPLLIFSIYGIAQRFPHCFFKGGPGRVYIQRHEPISTQGMTLLDKISLKNRCYQLIKTQLRNFAQKK